MREHSGQVVRLLEEYPAMKTKIELLRYELERAKAIPSSEIMVAMAFGRGSMERCRASGDASDPTLRIAVNYESAAERQRSEAVKDILSELGPLRDAADRLEHHVSLLEERQRALIRAIYFDGRAPDEVAEQLHIAPRTMRTIKKTALEQLAGMYEYIEGISKS